VALLAYMDGEESFLDKNGDNIWQAGETFFDVGLLYRDDNESGAFDAASEQTYPGGATGNVPCQGAGAGAGADAGGGDAAAYTYPSVANTCDGTWSSQIRVRRQSVIALATTRALITLQGERASGGFWVRVSDLNGNAMATGTTVAAKVVGLNTTCNVLSSEPPLVINSPNPRNHFIKLDGAADCLTVEVDVTVTPPSNLATVVAF